MTEMHIHFCLVRLPFPVSFFLNIVEMVATLWLDLQSKHWKSFCGMSYVQFILQ